LTACSREPASVAPPAPSAFPLFLVVRVCASLAFQMASVAIGWLVYARTGSAYDLGLVGLCQFVPMVVLTFVVGHVADRFDRRRIVALCQFISAVTLVVLAFGAGGSWLSVPAIFAAVAVLGAAHAFEHPTLAALLPRLVPAAILPRAVALSASAMQAATIAGPSLGGLLYAFGPVVPLGMAAAFSLAAVVAMAAIRMDRAMPNRSPVTLQSVFSGLGFIRARPVILGAISLDLFAVLLGGVTSLLPIFAHDVLNVGPWGLGLLRSAPAAGAVLTSLVLSRTGLGSAVGHKMFVAVVGFGIATIVFSLSSNMILSLASLVVLGAFDTVSVVIRSSLVQLATPDAMRGRVSAVNSLFIGTSNQLGDFESGMVAGLLGAVPAGVIGGVGTILVALAWAGLFPALRRISHLSAEELDARNVAPAQDAA
jgi:MFS family permease